MLASCYYKCLLVGKENGIRSIAFPSISTGGYAFPVELAAKIAVKTANRFLEENPEYIRFKLDFVGKKLIWNG